MGYLLLATGSHPPLSTAKKSPHRKSRPIKRDWASGNEAKFLSYREAWARIRLATKMRFYLEAVTIEESIISDRMLSFLEKSCGVVLGGHSLNKTSKEWIKHSMNRVGAKSESAVEAEAIFTKLNSWRELRNKVVHGIVKSKVSSHEDHIDNFLDAAAVAAAEGEKIARSVDR